MTPTNKTRTIFVCKNCGRETPKWLGRCSDCGEWNSFTETAVAASAPSAAPAIRPGAAPQELDQVSLAPVSRLALPLGEFNRVLGGGIVPGSLILIGGDPGIGKSTLMLQVAELATHERDPSTSSGRVPVVYVSGEESVGQIKLRTERLAARGKGLFLLAETNLEAILGRLAAMSPRLVIIDSIQTIYDESSPAAPGSLLQVRECTLRLMRWAKESGVPVLIAGHVTKDGAIAGPRVLEHMVDVVLYMEGETGSSYRILRGVKNRFGSTNEVGVFEMQGKGLVEVANPSEVFLSGRGEATPGSAVVPVLEGTRPLLVEVQALTSPTIFGTPRRTANGVDFNRLVLLAAVLGKRAGIPLGNQDVIVNVAGGIRVEEPAADLAIALAIASSFKETPVEPGLAAIGEVGLSGELRAVPQLERRLEEAARLGFHKCLIPARAGRTEAGTAKSIEIVRAAGLREAISVGLARGTKGGAHEN
ncbi:MAG: DNA repair protein RadA [Chloroflexi bacterium]|nr:DNA repair protein RadA [Chloroflexota bacterium]